MSKDPSAPGVSPILTFGPPGEQDRRARFAQMARTSPVPDTEFILNAGLYLTAQTLSRVLFMDFLYRQILDVQGIIVEFGCRWGQNLSLFTAMRGIYEPYNRLRKIVGFDTFTGLSQPAVQDGGQLARGDYATTSGYETYLEELLRYQEAESPLAHIRKFELHKGDATQTVPKYLDANPQTIIALAYFDFDLYGPTRTCLEAIKPYLTRGSVIGFDEANDPVTPGETVAIREVLGLDRYAIKRFPTSARTSYLVIV
jgi:hypothetical protein